MNAIPDWKSGAIARPTVGCRINEVKNELPADHFCPALEFGNWLNECLIPLSSAHIAGFEELAMHREGVGQRF